MWRSDFRSGTASRLLWLARAGLLGLAVWLLLLVFFSPRWIDFRAWTEVPEFARWAVSVRRGALVLAQVADPWVRIDDPLHAIIQHRLLIPGLGYLLGLGGPVVLALAHIGSAVLLAGVVVIARRDDLPGMGEAGSSSGAWQLTEAGALAVVFGASSWFFASNGWLGYYDSLVVLGLTVVVFSAAVWPVTVACLLVPWIDERFFLGFPAAVALRWLVAGEQPSLRTAVGMARALTWPGVVLAAQLGGRLALLGVQASPRFGSYFGENGLVAFLQSSAGAGAAGWLRLGAGVWEGLRLGWVVVLLGGAELLRRGERTKAAVFAGAVAVTVFVGLASANDLSRSMLLLSPAVLVAWGWARRFTWWHRWRVLGLLAGAALLLPASHVVTNFVLPIRPVWHEYGLLQKTPVRAYAQYHVGWWLAYEPGAPPDVPEAMRGLRQAAESGHDLAQLALGQLYLQERTGRKDEAAARRWFEAAAKQGNAEAEYSLGVLYDKGVGIASDPAEAVRWYRRAARQNHAAAQFNLAAMLANGQGVAADFEQAAAWLRIAAGNGNADARKALPAFEARLDEAQRERVQAQTRVLRREIAKRSR